MAGGDGSLGRTAVEPDRGARRDERLVQRADPHRRLGRRRRQEFIRQYHRRKSSSFTLRL